VEAGLGSALLLGHMKLPFRATAARQLEVIAWVEHECLEDRRSGLFSVQRSDWRSVGSWSWW
jgi:hypothetical protein